MTLLEIITAAFGGLISWLIYSKSARDKRFESKLSLYEELSRRLSTVFLYNTKFKREEISKEKFREMFLGTMEFVLVNKFIISQAVNDASLNFLNLFSKELASDEAREKLNLAVQAMRSELKVDVMDSTDQTLRIENEI